ncbi:MAG: hypothetical protein Q8M99_02685 [Methylotenera sp.]|nr:hypothetical protein [Methylotenera sp.]
MSNLPEQIQKQADEADKRIKAKARHFENHPRAGRPSGRQPKTTIIVPVATVEYGTDIEFYALCVAEAALGTRGKGNKRLGRIALYVDLSEYFLSLKWHNIKLPRYSLSAAQSSTELEQILIRHGYILASQRGNIERSDFREIIAKKLARVFIQIADAIE